jgi:hypothetical protein
MNSPRRRNRTNLLLILFAAFVVAALALGPGRPFSDALAAATKLDVEVPYEIKALKSAGLTAPVYVAAQGETMIVSDSAGGVYSVTAGGKATPLAGKDKVKSPGGVAVAPANFGSYSGQVFVLAAADSKSPCEVDRIDKSGAVSTFAKLADNGSLGGGKPSGCRDLEFGPSSGPYAGKLYAATTDNATLYAIDSSGKASVFGTYDKPLAMEITTVHFAPATDSKAPGMMLLGMRPTMAGAAKVGRIGIIAPDGKLKDDPYLVGFVRPGGFGYAPGNFGGYSGQFFIADTGRFASENSGMRDGEIYRVDKGIARPYGGGLVDPTDMKFIGNKMVLCDPADKGKPGEGAIVVITSLL